MLSLTVVQRVLQALYLKTYLDQGGEVGQFRSPFTVSSV